MKVCYCFDEDWRDNDSWGWPAMERSMVKSYVRAVPTQRRHAKFAFGTLIVDKIIQAAGGTDAAAQHLLGMQGVIWSTFYGPELSHYLGRTNIAGMVVDSMTPSDTRAMHLLLRDSGGYLGAMQVAHTNPIHWMIFSHYLIPKYRIYRDEMRMFHRGYETEASDDRDTGQLESWQASGLFSAVTWEDVGVQGTYFDPYDTAEHAGRTGELEELMSGQLASTLNEILIRASDLDPNLTTRLHAAIKAFEEHATVEQLAHVALSCRRFLEKLADNLYPARSEKMNGRDVGRAQYRNRLWAYASAQIESQSAKELILANLQDLGARIDAVDANANRGLHAESIASEINRLLISLLTVSHDLLTLAPPPEQISYAPYEDHIRRTMKDYLARED